MVHSNIILSSVLAMLTLPSWAQEARENYELYVYEEPVAKVEVIVPTTWKKDIERLAKGSDEDKKRLSLLLEATAMDALEMQVDGRFLPTPNPDLAWLVPKHEGGGYEIVQDPAKASHVGFEWILDRSVREKLDIVLQRPVFGQQGLFQSLKSSADAESGLVQTYPATLTFGLNYKYKPPLPLSESATALSPLSPRIGPSPRMILWVVLGLLILIMQVRKSRSISTRGAIVAVVVLFAVVGAWFIISPHLKATNKKWLSKLPQNHQENLNKNKAAQKWLEGFLTSLNTPKRPNARGYLAAMPNWSEWLDSNKEPSDSEGILRRSWKLLTFEPEYAEEYEEKGLKQFQWSASSERWAWGGADMKVITGKVRFDTMRELGPSAQILDLKVEKMD